MLFEAFNVHAAQAVLDRLVALRIVASNGLLLALVVVVVIIHRGAGAP